MTQIGYDQIDRGWKVYGTDGQEIGSISDVNDSYVTVSKGLFMPKDYFVPVSAIQDVRPDEQCIYVSAAKDDLDALGWDQPGAVEGDRGVGATRDTGYTTESSATRGSASSETQRVSRYEEELRAEKSSRQAGEVQLSKDVTEEEQSFEVPVTREDVEVQRVAVNRPASGTEEAFSDGEVVRVPVRAEQVEVTKEPRVVEEIEIRKTPREETQRVSDTVRKERVNVGQTGDVNVQGDAGYSTGGVPRDERELAGTAAGADRFEGQHDFDRAAGDQPAGFERVEDEDSDRTDEPRAW